LSEDIKNHRASFCLYPTIVLRDYTSENKKILIVLTFNHHYHHHIHKKTSLFRKQTSSSPLARNKHSSNQISPPACSQPSSPTHILPTFIMLHFEVLHGLFHMQPSNALVFARAILLGGTDLPNPSPFPLKCFVQM